MKSFNFLKKKKIVTGSVLQCEAKINNKKKTLKKKKTPQT
jgi:hypothetical protein